MKHKISDKHKRLPPYLGENYESHWGIFSFTGKTVLDVGADYGSTTSFFLEKGAKKVIAVEPDPDLFGQLVSNYSDDRNVVAVNTRVTKGEDLALLIAKFSPDLLKLDCEGCEIYLADIDEPTLRKVPEYLVETHDHILPTKITQQIEDLFEDIRYSHETYEVLPGVRVVHAKERWQVLSVSEKDIIRSKNAILLQAENALGVLRNQCVVLKAELTQSHSEVEAAISKLLYAESELQDIKRSFGYNFMCFYASIIDRLLPEGTRRGEFKRILVSCARIAVTEGIMSLLSQASQKLKRREFTIVGDIPSLEGGDRHKTEPRHELEKKGSTEVPDILIHCEFPELSEGKSAKISDWFAVTGWAISRNGIREVRVYLDDALLGIANYGTSRPDIGAAFPDFPASEVSGFRKMVIIEEGMKRGPQRLTIVAEDNNQSSATASGIIEVPEDPLTAINARNQIQPTKKPINAKISVIVVTKSIVSELEQTLERAKSQEGVDSEITVLGPASGEFGPIVDKYGAKFVNIDSETHDGSASSDAFDHVSGDYIFFVAEDAIPVNNHLLRDLVLALENEPKAAVATTQQIPRTDADLMACAVTTGHRIELEGVKTLNLQDMESLEPEEKMRMIQAYNVCSCFRKDVLQSESFAAYECAEAAHRLMSEGWDSVLVSSTGVIHSHNLRPSEYLSHAYVETMRNQELFGTRREIGSYDLGSIDHVVDCAMDLYNTLCSAIAFLENTRFCDRCIPDAFKAIKNAIADESISAETRASANHDLLGTLSKIAEIAHHTENSRPKSNPMRRAYIGSIPLLERYVSGTHKDLSDIETHFVEALYQLAGKVIGTCMAWQTIQTRLNRHPGERETRVNEFLSRGLS